MGKRIVIALGGNALGSTPYEQLALVMKRQKADRRPLPEQATRSSLRTATARRSV